MPEINLDRDEINAILSRWSTVVYKVRGHEAEVDSYQQGEIAAYKTAINDLEGLIKKYDINFEGKIKSINNTIKTRKLAVKHISNIIVAPLALIFGFIIFVGQYSLITMLALIVCIFWLLSKQWINDKPVAGQAIAFIVGLSLVILTKVGADTISIVPQAMVVMSGQILGGAFVGFLLLFVKKPRESKLLSVLLTLLFVFGLFTLLRFQPDLIKESFTTSLISIIGIIGSETLGAGITVSLIGSWLDDEINESQEANYWSRQ